MKYSLALAVVIFLASCNGGDKPADTGTDPSLLPHPTPAIAYNIVNIYPHDTTAYTEGLQFYNDKLYEGTGDYTKSALQVADIKTGKILQKHTIGKNATDSTFGEGINVFKGKIYELTWQTHIVFVYDEKDISKPIKTFNWPYDGWGLTNDGTNLIASDGSANLYIIDPETFKLKSTIAVTEDSNPVENLNELEYVNGFIFANIWQTNFIVKIDLNSGHVVGKMDFTGVIEKHAPGFKARTGDEVLNGIAYDSTAKKFYVTGKRWPKMFEITLN
jgi:glutamine cyclotransferase